MLWQDKGILKVLAYKYGLFIVYYKIFLFDRLGEKMDKLIDNGLYEFVELMRECGFDISEETMDRELFYDSLQFVSTMVMFEEKYAITIPEQYLTAEGLNTGQDLYEMVMSVLENKEWIQNDVKFV